MDRRIVYVGFRPSMAGLSLGAATLTNRCGPAPTVSSARRSD